MHNGRSCVRAFKKMILKNVSEPHRTLLMNSLMSMGPTAETSVRMFVGAPILTENVPAMPKPKKRAHTMTVDAPLTTAKKIILEEVHRLNKI